MKRFLILTAIAALGAAQLPAAINGADARAYFERGVEMYRDKNYNGCIDQLLQMRQLDPTAAQSEEALYYLAMSTLHSGDDEALDLLTAFLQAYPQSVLADDVTMSIGDYYFNRTNYGDALRAYRHVNVDNLALDRRDDLIYRSAYSSMLLGEDAEALRGFEALAESPAYGNASLFYRGYIAYLRGDYASARKMMAEVDPDKEPGQAAPYYLCQLDFLDANYESAAAQAIRLLEQPGAPESFRSELLRVAGESLYNTGQTSRAIPYLREYAADTDNPRPTACYMLGVAEYNDANYPEAVSMLRRATSLDDRTGQSAYLYLGKAYVGTGDTDAALMAFDKARRMTHDPLTSETAAYDYIVARANGGRIPFGNSVEIMEEFLMKYPKSKYADEVRENLVAGYMSESDYDNALRILDRIASPSARMQQARQRVLLMNGIHRYQGGDPEGALPLLRQGAAMRTSTPEVGRQCVLWEAQASYDLGDYAGADNAYSRYLASAPATDSNLTTARYNAGYSKLRLDDYADALALFEKVAADSRADSRTRADAMTRAADCLYCMRRFSEAGNRYAEAVAIDPSAADYAMFQQSEMKGYNRDYASRIAIIDRLADAYPSSPLLPDALMAKAESYTLLNRPADAADVYSQIASRYASTEHGRKAALMLAVNLLETGDRQSAMQAYRDVVTTYPSSDEARVALEDLKTIYAEQGRLPDYVAFVNSLGDDRKVEISEFEATAFDLGRQQYDTDGSTAGFETYIAQFPAGSNAPQALIALAETASDSGNMPQALAYASKVADGFPDSPQAEDALLIKADAEMALGKGEAAFSSYRTLEERASDQQLLTAARLGVMETGVKLGRFDQVLDATAKLLASSAAGGETPRIQFYRAIALERTGNGEEARQLWSTLAKDPSSLTGAKSAVYLIESLIPVDLAAAERHANEFIDAGSPHNYWYARGFIAYSDILRRQGKDYEADEYLKTLRSNYPGTEADIFEMIESRLQR